MAKVVQKLPNYLLVFARKSLSNSLTYISQTNKRIKKGFTHPDTRGNIKICIHNNIKTSEEEMKFDKKDQRVVFS